MRTSPVFLLLVVSIQFLLCLSPFDGSSLFAQELPCLRCHKSKNAGENIHIVIQMGCAVCHLSPHEEEKPILSLAKDLPGLCYNCHDKEKFSGESQHIAVTAGMCISCHNPHASDLKGLLVARGAELCYSCHDKKKFAGKSQHTAVTAGMCSSCHSPHASQSKSLLVAKGAELCYSCHDREKFKKKYVHSPVESGSCSLCHNPHASDHAANLKQAPLPLCISCHKEQSTGKHVIFGFGGDHPIIGKPDPVRKGRDLSCTSCHDPHASNLALFFTNESLSPNNLCQMCHKK